METVDCLPILSARTFMLKQAPLCVYEAVHLYLHVG